MLISLSMLVELLLEELLFYIVVIFLEYIFFWIKLLFIFLKLF